MLSVASYIPCGRPAVAIIYHERDKRGYFMCQSCAYHNVCNRGGKWVGGSEETEYLRELAMDEDDAPLLRVNHIGIVICPSCKGVGHFVGRDGTMVRCVYCQGNGKVLEPCYVVRREHDAPGN